MNAATLVTVAGATLCSQFIEPTYGTTSAVQLICIEQEVIPMSFFDGIMDCTSGRVVDLDVALEEEPTRL